MIINRKSGYPSWQRLIPAAIFALLLFVAGFFPSFVEKVYAQALYPAISLALRLGTRWIPFSLGDVIYIVFFLRVLISLIRFLVAAARRKLPANWVARAAYQTAHFFIWLYIVFRLAWGLNYNRLGIEHQLFLRKDTYNTEEIVQLTNQLIDKLNETRRLIPDTVLPEPPTDTVFRDAFRAYQAASLDYDFLNYRNRSVKASLFTSLGDYMGFSGYYNPFTGEAQVRTDVPRVLLPYITTHEMAHQLGYASESEANFVGYLAASRSTNPWFRYSVYLDLFSYAQREEMVLLSATGDRNLFDSVLKSNKTRLDTLVKKDRREIREFFAKRSNRISPTVSSIYDQYLKLNRQSEGIQSYDEVIGWLMAYQRKYGRL